MSRTHVAHDVELAGDLIDYVLATRHDERFTDAGIAAALGMFLDELADELVADEGDA